MDGDTAFGLVMYGIFMGLFSGVNSIFIYNFIYKRTGKAWYAQITSVCFIMIVILVMSCITLKNFGRPLSLSDRLEQINPNYNK